MTLQATFSENDHVRTSSGQFGFKDQGSPEIDLTIKPSLAYDPTFFYDRSNSASELLMVHEAGLSPAIGTAVRNATQAINDAWILDNDIDEREARGGSWVDTTVFEDGDFTIADIQHKDQNRAPYGTLVIFDQAGSIVGQFDNEADKFGERWVPAAGLRGQLLSDLAESSRNGELGDQL